jgi:hypothetical protein
MDEINGSTVELNILLNGGFLGLVLIARADGSVKDSEAESQSPEGKEFHDGPEDVEHHGVEHGVADVIEPERVEVWDLSLEEESEEGSLFLHVGVGSQEQEGSVEELDNEDSISNELGLF